MKKLLLLMVLVAGLCSVASAALVKVDVAGVTACGEHYSGARGPGHLIDDSGMDGPGLDALHDNVWSNMWMSDGNVGTPQHPGTVIGSHWVEFDLGEVRSDLDCMGIWNYNELNWPWFGMKDITVEYSADGANYATLYQGVLPMAHQAGTNPSAVDLVLDMTGVAARYVVITAAVGEDVMPGSGDRNWSYDRSTYFNEACLSEVRFYAVPEPVTMLLLSLGGLALARRRK